MLRGSVELEVAKKVETTSGAVLYGWGG